MSEINSQALREAAEQAMHDNWGFVADLFHELVTPSIVLALLNERERNQQYVKRRDKENEEIALTVGRLRVELEGKHRRITELTMWIKRLSSSLKNAKPDSKLPDDAMIWLNNEGLTSIEDILR